ncbi:MAG: hypothetical protein ABSG65_21180 [Bryobacteraceae bacterium]|jgi:hypothetical protein
MAMAQIAVLQIKVVEGEAAVRQPGARIAHPLTVEVTDEAGRPVSGAAVSFQLPPEGPSGLFSNGLRTDLVLTDGSGRATLRSVQLNRTPGTFRIRITAVKEQARAGAVSTQYIAGGPGGPPANSARATPAAPVPATPKSTTTPVAQTPPAPQTPTQTEAKSAEITRTVPAQDKVKSGEITPTTVKMGSSHKKWIILAAIVAAGAGAAFLGISHAGSPGSKSTVSSSVVSLGTPGITIGNP